MKTLAFLLLILSGLALADTRGSSVTASGNTGPGDFRSQAVDAAIGASEEWLLLGSYYRSTSGFGRLTGEELVSTELRGGADWRFDKNASAAVGVIRRSDPYELQGRGLSAGMSYDLNSLWKGERLTRFSFSVQEIQFTQEVTFVGARATLNLSRNTSQRKGTLSLIQEVTDWLQGFVTFTRYNYAGDADRLNLVTRRRRTAWSGTGLSYGQPDRSYSASLTLYPIEWAETTLSGTRTRLYGDDNPENHTSAITQAFFYKGYMLAVDYSVSTFTRGSAGTDPSTQEFYGAQFGYEW